MFHHIHCIGYQGLLFSHAIFNMNSVRAGVEHFELGKSVRSVAKGSPLLWAQILSAVDVAHMDFIYPIVPQISAVRLVHCIEPAR